MTLPVRAPRLLPATIAVLAMVLVGKSIVLVRSAILDGRPAAFITAAWAAGPEAAKPIDLAPPAKSGPTKPPAVTEPRAVADGPPPVTDGERAVLLDLRERRRELEAREATLTGRESMLAAAETKLSARVEELQALQKKLESLDTTHKQQEDVAWLGLVKVYETMKPRDAAAIFNELGMQVLLSVIDRMKEAKAAAILAAMTPDKARDVTAQLALSRTRSAVEIGEKPALVPEPGKASGT